MKPFKVMLYEEMHEAGKALLRRRRRSPLPPPLKRLR